VAWPAIAGIDMEEARNRLCDDPTLFRSSLQRFLGDFSDIAVPSPGSVPLSLTEQASRLHKLKGGAGILGAKAIQHLAGEAEAACLAGDGAGAQERSIEIVTHLNALRSSTLRAFEDARPSEAPTAAPRDIRLEPQAVAERERIVAPPSKPLRDDSEGRCRVLLVDDDDIVRTVVAKVLERAGYRVGEATSGEEALRALRGGDYRIVITDWKMPGMSGLELCRELRVENRDLYVMMLTMSAREQDEDLGRDAGADAYVLKSSSHEEIITRMAAAREIAQLRYLAHRSAHV
jgi:CheY-like chemotaxis protein